MKSKNPRTAIIVVYLIAVHVLLIAALVSSDIVPRTVAWLGMARDVQQPPEEIPFIPMMRGVHAWMDASVPAGATIFLGDSITMALATAAVAPYSVNYGISWQRSDQLMKSMDIYQSIARAGRVFVMVGTNDVLEGREADIQSRYQAILTKIPANVDVVMNSIPPVGDVVINGRTISDKTVRDVGAIAQTVCEADKRCHFVDAYEALSTDGKPTQGVLMPDQIHLSPKGYQLWIEAMRHAGGSP
ncbi:MAG TPA: SGNH/GDSL hydrolase family protein [Pseudomonadales bacterium]|nr:SGNH/GDSL hydrolase family protein [Pseudomonadales bacterium]